MDCLNNGSPGISLKAKRIRLFQEVFGPGFGPIALTYTFLWEAKLEQISAHWSAGPLTSEDLTVTRDSVDGVRYDTVFRREDPSVGPIVDWVCTEDFRFSKGDILKVDYPNTDNNEVGVTVWIVQVDN